MTTEMVEVIDVDALSDEQLDRLMERIDQRREKREAEERARQAAIKRSHTPAAAFDRVTEFKMKRRDMECVDDRERGVRIFQDGAYIALAGPLAELAGMFDMPQEPTDALTKTAVRADFYRTRARLIHEPQRQRVLTDNRQLMESGISRTPPQANIKELARLDGLIAADTAEAKRLEGLCDLINQIKTQHQDDEALRDRLIEQVLETESNGDVKS
jgi:hypothetical protein